MPKTERKIIKFRGRKMIAGVYHFLKQEYEFTKQTSEPKADLSHLRNVSKRTAEACGVSLKTVERILKEEKQQALNPGVPPEHVKIKKEKVKKPKKEKAKKPIVNKKPEAEKVNISDVGVFKSEIVEFTEFDMPESKSAHPSHSKNISQWFDVQWAPKENLTVEKVETESNEKSYLCI